MTSIDDSSITTTASSWVNTLRKTRLEIRGKPVAHAQPCFEATVLMGMQGSGSQIVNDRVLEKEHIPVIFSTYTAQLVQLKIILKALATPAVNLDAQT